MATHTEYLLGSDDEEVTRLQFQNEVWRRETDQVLAAASFQSGETLLDLGCGPGLTTFHLAEAVGPSGKVIGVDTSERFVEMIRANATKYGIHNVAVQHGDVLSLPLSDRSIDGVFARWLMCFVENPQAVVREMARILRPGGRFAVIDYFNYAGISLQPPSELFRRVFAGVYKSFAASGCDLDIGGKLPQLMIDAGFELSALIPINAVGGPGSKYWRWVSDFQAVYLPRLVEEKWITGDELAAFRQEWDERAKRDGSFFFAPPMIGILAIRK